MKNTFALLRSKGLKLQAAIVASTLVLSNTVHAALPAWATTSVTQAQTDGLALIELVGPAVAAVTIGFVLIKIFKRGANKI